MSHILYYFYIFYLIYFNFLKSLFSFHVFVLFLLLLMFVIAWINSVISEQSYMFVLQEYYINCLVVGQALPNRCPLTGSIIKVIYHILLYTVKPDCWIGQILPFGHVSAYCPIWVCSPVVVSNNYWEKISALCQLDTNYISLLFGATHVVYSGLIIAFLPKITTWKVIAGESTHNSKE